MNTDLMIAYLPSDGSWCQQELPHMTLVWGGPVVDLPDSKFNELAKDAISAARVTGSFSLNVTGIQELGGGDSGKDPVDALIFYPTAQLLLARNIVQKWDAAGFPTYLPHATIGPAGSAAAMSVPSNVWPDVNGRTPVKGLPASLWFNRILVCWGDKRIAFDISDM
jgi:2'-5' RNA ligase